MPTQYVLNNLSILCGEKDEIYTYIAEKLKEDKLWIVTLNALMYMEYLKMNEYSEALKMATFSIPDGVGIVKLLKRKGLKLNDARVLIQWNFYCICLKKEITIYIY